MKETDDDPCARFRKSRVSVSRVCFFLHVLLLPVFSKTSMKVRIGACWFPKLLRGDVLAPSEGAPPHYLHQHVQRPTSWGIGSDLSKSAAFPTIFALQLSPFLTVACLATEVVIEWRSGEGPRASFVSRCHVTMSTDGGDLWFVPWQRSSPRVVAHPFRHHLAYSYLCEIDVPVHVVATWSCCRCALQHFCHIAPFSLMLSVLSSPRCRRLRLRDPTVSSLHMQLM